MLVSVKRKVKINKTSAKAARKRRIAEVDKMVDGLTLDQIGRVCRYIKLLRSTAQVDC